MENQDIDLLGKTVGNMFYKVGIIDKDGNLKNQFVAKASTNRVDIPQAVLGTSEVPQIPSTTNLFSGSAVGNILLSGPSANYDNIQDGLLLTLSNQTSVKQGSFNGAYNQQGQGKIRFNLSSIGLKLIKIPKDKLIVGNSFDISDQLPQCIGKIVDGAYEDVDGTWHWLPAIVSIASFKETTINVLPNTTLSMNLIVELKNHDLVINNDFSIPVVQVNDYKN